MDHTLPIDLDRFTLLDKLGEGGFGEVYLARDLVLDRPVALKMVHHDLLADENSREILAREARATAKLEHPGIVRVYDFLPLDGYDCIVMEYLRGNTLRDRLLDAPLKLEEAWPLFRDVIEGLAFAHSHGILHRDVKPGNIWVSPEGQTKILDFGIAQQVSADEDTTARGPTARGPTVGTVRYMSPEQVLGRKLDARSDLFALGIVFYETLTGRAPFEGESQPEIVAKIITETPISVCELRPEVPKGISQLIDRLLAKNPEDRPADATRVRQDLEALLEEVETPAATFRQQAKWAALGLVAILLLLFFSIRLNPATPDRPSVLVVAEVLADDSESWRATAVLEAINAYLDAGAAVRIVDGDQASLLAKRLPPTRSELDEDQRERIGELLDVDYLASIEIFDDPKEPTKPGLRVRLHALKKPGPSDSFRAESPLQVAQQLRLRMSAPPLDEKALSTAEARLPSGPALRAHSEGLEALRRFSPMEAMDKFEQALEAAPDHPAILFGLARARLRTGQPGAVEAALEAAKHAGGLSDRRRRLLEAAAATMEDSMSEKAEGIYRTLGSGRGQGSSVLELDIGLPHSYVFLARGQTQAAQEILDRTKGDIRTSIDEAQWGLAQARILLKQEGYEAAGQRAQRVAEIGVELEAHRLCGQAELLRSIALWPYVHSRPASDQALHRALHCFGLAQDLNGQLDALGQRASFMIEREDGAEAARLIERYLENFEQSDEPASVARLLNSLGGLLNNGDFFTEAISEWQQSKELYSQMGFALEVAVVELNMGAAAHELGRWSQAAELYERALGTFVEHELPSHQAAALSNLGELRFHAGELDASLKLHLKALGLKQSLGLPPGHDLFRLAEVYRRQGRLQDSAEHFQQARDTMLSLGEPVADVLIGFARLETERRNLGDAIELASQAREEARGATARGATARGAPARGATAPKQVDSIAFAQLAQAEALILKPEPDLKTARTLLTYARNQLDATENPRLSLEFRRLDALVRRAEGKDPGDITELIRDAEAAGYHWVAEDVRLSLL